MNVRSLVLPGLFATLVWPAMAALPATPITLTAGPNPSNLGARITLTASTVFGATGKVTFYTGTTVIGIEPVTLNGSAFLTTTLLPSGRNLLKAYYSGDATHAAATSAVLTQTVKALPDGSLHAPVAYGGGSSIMAIASGDFDGDDVTDLAVIFEELGVTVLKGNGDGTFRPQTVFSTGENPVAVVVGDFNGDGQSDLAVCNSTSNTVSVLLKEGGTFHWAVDYNTGTHPSDLAAADINGDGIVDLITVNAGTNTFSVLLGKGDGTFFAAVDHTLTANMPSRLLVADFNGDGKADLAVGFQTGIAVFLGKGDGSFQAEQQVPVGNGFYRFAVGDFNGDGKMDLAVLNTVDLNTNILLGQGNGTFQSAGTVAVGTAPQDLAVGDFNGDGVADLAVTSGSPPSLTILTGKGDGTFLSPTAYNLTDPDPRGLVVGDFNGDGMTDVAIVQHYFGSIGIMLGLPPVTAVTFQSNKPGVTVMVDGAAPQATPFTLQLTRTVHTLSIAPVQGPGNTYQYVFLNWSDNDQVSADPASSHKITVTDTPFTCEADVKIQYQLVIQASPAGEGTVTPASGGYYNPGAMVDVTALPAPSFGLSSWTGPVANAASASTTATVGDGKTIITAKFAPLRDVTFQSTPPGALVSIDGNSGIPTPFTLSLVEGGHTVSAQHMITLGIGIRDVFQSWSDGGAMSHAFTVGTSPSTLTAVYVKQYQLETIVFPDGAGTLTISPAAPSGDDCGCLNADTIYTATAAPAPGYTFSGFEGAATGSVNPQTFTLTGPTFLVAEFIPPNPVLAGAVSRSVTVDGQTVNLILTLTNSGLSTAMVSTLTSLTASVLSGSGSVSVASPALPHYVANIPAGGAVGIPVQLTLTGPVSRVKLTFGGTMTNTIATNFAFGGAAQVILP